MQPIPMEASMEIQSFLLHEASLLDEGRFDKWLDLLTDDVRYVMPVRWSVEPNREPGNLDGNDSIFSLFDDDKASLAIRVQRIKTGIAPSDVPESVVVRFVTNIRAEHAGNPGEFEVRSNFLVHQERRGRDTATFVGKRHDTLRRERGSLKLARRRIDLGQTILPATISILF